MVNAQQAGWADTMAVAKKDDTQRKFMLGLNQLPAQHNDTLFNAADILSQHNHRKYDQEYQYMINIHLEGDAPDGTSYDVYTIKDTWMTRQAYALARAVYNENTKEELAMMEPKMKAKWGGFRMASGLTDVNSGVSMQLVQTLPLQPAFGQWTPLNTGEFYSSEVTASAGQAFFTWFGESTPTQYNIIEQLDKATNAIPSPSTVNTVIPYDGVEVDVSTSSATYEHLQQDGNLPPYSRDDIETSLMTKVGTIFKSASGSQKLSTGFFPATNGFFVIVGYAPNLDNQHIVQLEVKKGTHQGVACEQLVSPEDIQRWESRLNG
jgi:hypothetical protein